MTDTFYSVADFVSIMGEAHPRLLPAISEVAATWPDTAKIRALTYDYATLDEQEQPITMSALMLLPYVDGAMKARTLWLENRATQSADKNVPTRRWNIGEAHVLNNHVLVSPDLMSFGASIDRPICYCHSGLAARNTVDAVLAAENMLLREFQFAAPLPVSFYHAHEDECVPVECMQAVEEAWGHLPNVTFEDDMMPATDIPNRMVHAYSGGVFHRRLLTDKKL